MTAPTDDQGLAHMHGEAPPLFLVVIGVGGGSPP